MLKTRVDLNVYTKLLLAAAVIFLTLSACDKEPTPPCTGNECNPDTTGVLMPLQPGNYWRYLIWNFIDPDTVIGEISREIPVTIDGVIYNAAAYRLPYWIHGTPPPFEWLYWNGPEGLYWLGGIAARDTLLHKTLLFKYPAEVGDSWTTVRIDYDHWDGFYYLDTLTVDLVSKDETIETPTGNFQCHVYHYRKKLDDIFVPLDYYHYFIPDVGRIAFISKWADDQAIFDKMLLIDYKLSSTAVFQQQLSSVGTNFSKSIEMPFTTGAANFSLQVKAQP